MEKESFYVVRDYYQIIGDDGSKQNVKFTFVFRLNNNVDQVVCDRNI